MTMDEEYRKRLDAIVHHAAEAEAAINAADWNAASWAVAAAYEAAYNLQRYLPHPEDPNQSTFF